LTCPEGANLTTPHEDTIINTNDNNNDINNESELKGVSKISIKEIMKNPALARMIVLASKKLKDK
jgi:hypothetical protein